jgi:hypothetical protein
MDSLADIHKDSAKLRTEKLALSRDLDVLKPEIEHLKSQVAHQKTVLAEKLALERQINALEVELANEKRAVEKLHGRDRGAEDDLRQQIRDLEKQLAKEKRAGPKALQEEQHLKSAEMNQEISALRSQLADAEQKLATIDKQRKADAKAAKVRGADNAELAPEELQQLRLELAETKKELANEKKDKERMQKDGEKALAEAESLRLPLEERIDNLKAKLRDTREQLKECRADLEKAEQVALAAATTTKVPTKKAAAAKAAPAGAKKRRVNEISAPGMSVLQTPGKDDERPRRTFKKPFAPAAVGEKSTFSITPFLNKTVNLSDTSLHPITEDGPEEQGAQAEVDGPSAGTDSPSEVPAKKRHLLSNKTKTKAKAALAESSPTKHNMQAPKSREVSSAESTLDKVVEEVEEDVEQENQAPIAHAPKQRKGMVLKNRTIPSAPAATTEAAESMAKEATAAAPAPPPAPVVAEPKKKKRKLLGGASTGVLFDGAADAEDAPAPTTVVVPKAAAPNKRMAIGKMALGGGAGLAAKRAVGLGTKNAFGGGSFSPLKRDRRGVNASFLA